MNINTFLKLHGFTDYDCKVYQALIELGTAKAAEISKRSTVPSNKVYESLIRLTEKGFIASLNITPQQYTITSTQPFKLKLTEQEQQVRQQKQQLAILEQTIQKKIIEQQNIALVLKGKDKIMQMLHEMTEKTQKYQYTHSGNLIFSHTGGRLVKQAIERGVDVRFLVKYDTTRKKVYEQWQSIGVKIRFYPQEEQKSIRFSTFDDKICRITIGNPQIVQEEDYLSFWIESPALSILLKEQFLQMWEKCT
ncbi:hypothetical protein HYT55_04880 [Candidatus Woesearchaeota archaeon]|nr:hypothetical protein [Candidatus Woesearchaeota archaeon]